MSTAKSRKRARSTSPIQSAGLLGKKPRIAEDFDADMPISQASGETEASSRSVEELAAAGNHAVVHRLAVQLKALDVRLEQFADPKECILLPFPYTGVIPKRFRLEFQENVFRFYGRTAWMPIYEQVKKMNAMQCNRLHLHGTLGAGKSYLLAALVCQLQREGVRVVYLPDCYELLLCEPPVLYILPSLYSAFYQDPVLGRKVNELAQTFFEKGRTREDLEWGMTMFCNLAAQVERPILWVVDQANALDDGEYDRVSSVKKIQTRGLLDGLSSKHMKLSSSTANYSAAEYDQMRATSESRINLYLGLDDVEMVEWWRRQGNAYGHLQKFQFEPAQTEALERLTGRMPLFLRGLEHVLANPDLARQVAIGSSDAGPSTARSTTGTPTMGAQLIQRVHARLVELPETVKLVGAINRYASAKFAEFSGSGNGDARTSFQRGWEACIFEKPLAESECAHLDGRFFFRQKAEDGVYVGRTTCDLVRTVGAARLRQIQNLADFGEKPWVNRIAHAGDHPAVLGFLVERAVLGILVTSGTKFAGPEVEFDKALELQKFSGKFPNDAPKRNNKATIYVPTAYNYAAVDAILAARPKRRDALGESMAVVVGIQVTISDSHSDSESAFMRSWQDWEDLMASEVTIFRFIWIVETVGGDLTENWENVPEKIVTLRGKRSIVHPAYQRRYISMMTFNGMMGERLKEARN